MTPSSPRRAASFVVAVVLLILFSGQPHAASKAQSSHEAATDTHANPTAAGQPTSGTTTTSRSKEFFIVRRRFTRAIFHNDGTGRSDLLVVVTVQSPAAVKRFGHLVFTYNSLKQKFNVLSVQVRKAGSSKFIPSSAVWDMVPLEPDFASVYSGYREKVVTVPGLRKGDTLSYHVELVTQVPAAPGQFWFEYDFEENTDILDEQVDVSVPRGRDLTLKTQPGFEPTITEDGAMRTYRWTLSHPAQIPAQTPAQTNGHPQQQDEGRQTPAIQLTTFRNWDQVGRWYAALEAKRAAPNAEVRARADALTHGLSSEREKVEALYDFVQTQLRPVDLPFGMGGYQPHAAAEVLANRYGNSNDKHTLLESLLAAKGIRAYPVLIPSLRRIDPGIPSPARFDHRMLVVPQGADAKHWIWLDVSTAVAPFGMLAAHLRGKQALVIPTAEARGASPGPARLMETPEDPPFRQFQRIQVTGRVTRTGTLTAHIRYSMTGDNALALRMAFHRTPRSGWEQLGELLSLNDGFRAEVANVKASDPQQTHKPFEVDYEFTQAKFLDWSRKNVELILPLPAIGMPEVSGTADRTEALPLGSPLEVDLRANIVLPPGSRLRLPVPVNLTRDYATYHSRYSLQGDRIIAQRRIVFLRREIPPDLLVDYLAFARALRMDQTQAVGVERNPPAPPAPKTPKAPKN